MNEQPATDTSADSQSKPEVFSEGFQFREFSAFLAGLMPLAFIVLGVIEASGLLWRPIAGVLYLLALSAGMFFLIGTSLDKKFAKPGQEEVVTGLIVASAILVVVGFSQLGRYLYLWFGGFTAIHTGYWHWIRFGIANVLESVLFDMPAIYKWNVSEIEAIGFWSQTLLFLFRTSLEFLVVVQIVRAVGFAKQTWKNASSSQHKHHLSFIFSELGWLLVLTVWAVPLFISIGAIANDGLSLDSTANAFKFGLPVAFAVWVAWESLRALFLVNGRWNKLFALVGIIFGLWLARESWPTFRIFMNF